MTENEKNDNVIKLMKIIEKTPELRAIFMQQLLHSSYEIEENLKKLPTNVDDRVKKQIDISINELKEQIILIREAIGTLPADLDSQVAAMTSAVYTSHENVENDIKHLEERIAIANGMALQTVAEAMQNSVTVFEKNMREAKNKVFNEGVEVVKETNRQMAWVIIGATVIINLISVGVTFFVR